MVYFVRSGRILLSDDCLENSGVGGYDWLSRPYSNTTTAYFLYFNTSNVEPSTYTGRWIGIPLRCLAD